MAGAFRLAVQTRFADLDAQGHVNNVAFLTFMETARVQFFDGVRDRLGRVVVARSECDHLREMSAHVRTVHVEVSVESVGRTSFALRHDLTVDGEPVGRGRVVMVKVDAASRPVPIDDDERALLLSLTG